MPSENIINPDLIRAIFTYDPETGALIPKPTADLVARQIHAPRRMDTHQWEVGKHRYSLHRLVWAYHHPENPNPKYVGRRSSSPFESRIEHLYASDVHPRWIGNRKQVRARIDSDGRITIVGAPPPAPDATPQSAPSLQAIARIPVSVRPPAPTIDTSFVDEFDQGDFGARPGDTFDANDYDYQ